MRALIRNPGGQVDTVPLQRSTLWVGSDPTSDLRLLGAGIAPRHARLDLADDGRYGVVDLGAPSGTRVNGERVVTAGPLGPDDVVWIGELALRIVADATPLPAAESSPMSPLRVVEREPTSGSAVTSWLAGAGAARAAQSELAGLAEDERFLAVAGRVHQRLLEQFEVSDSHSRAHVTPARPARRNRPWWKAG